MGKLLPFVKNNEIKIVATLASILSVVSFIYYFNHAQITAYGDSRGHLDIARRVVDSLTPGITQLGGYWLPLLHLAMLPTIWNDFMWQSGLSGAIPNMCLYVLSIVYIYKLSLEISDSRLSAIIAVLALGLNPNLLYLQSAPMTEAMFVGTLILFFYFYYRWLKYGNVQDLILSAAFAFLCSINRYEGWGLVIAANAGLIYQWIQHKFDRKYEGALIIFATFSFAGIFMWLLWGLVIFHDPLQFMHNELSAANQTRLYDNWFGYHSVYESIATNFLAIVHMVNWGIISIFIVSLVGFIWSERSKIYNIKSISIFLLMVPFLFDALTVYLGNVPVEVPEFSRVLPPGNYFNIRYALYSMPFIAIILAQAFKGRYIKLFILAAVIGFNVFQIGPDYSTIVSLKDVGANPGSLDYKESYRWFSEQYTGGLIMASTGGSDSWIFRAGIPLKNYITEGSLNYWDVGLEKPQLVASWVIISSYNENDLLKRRINNDNLDKYFVLVYKNSATAIYKINE